MRNKKNQNNHSPNDISSEKTVINNSVEKSASRQSSQGSNRTDQRTTFTSSNVKPSIQPKIKSEDQGAQTDSNHAELNRINEMFQAQNNEHGFRQAQGHANDALIQKKIRLNNRFDLISVIGAGGMGTVFKAKDLRKIEAQDENPFVAVKVLNSDFKEHPNAFISLQREASRSHLLSHPHIVTVHDFDRDGSIIYMTMELLKGEPLDRYLARQHTNGVNKELAFKFLEQFAEALDYAHKKGIIHCDLKPANIFISDQGVKILDFGIARLASKSKLSDKFDAGSIGALTPEYASLEMLQKKTPEASDDVYAAAIITYKLLTGKHPFDDRPAATALGLFLEPKRISSLSNRQWKAMLKGLAFKREDRTQTIAEFHKGLTESFRLPVFKVLSAVLLVLVMWFAFTRFFMPDELTVFVNDSMQKATSCFENKNYNCALNGVNAVLEIEPNHIQAKAMHSQIERAIQEQNKLQRAQVLLKQAKDCLSNENYQCVVTNANEVLATSINNRQAIELKNKGLLGLKEEQEKQKSLSEQYNRNLNRANQCLMDKGYSCAIRYAKEAEKIKPDNGATESIIQSANYALQQLETDRERADKILQDGESCFKKLNYSCAIAKSESVIEIVANHDGALALKRKAEKAISDAKKNIQIE